MIRVRWVVQGLGAFSLLVGGVLSTPAPEGIFAAALAAVGAVLLTEGRHL